MGRRADSREYIVEGPFTIPVQTEEIGKSSYRHLFENVADSFFSDSDVKHYAAKIGLYIFARKHGENFTPVYVGKTTATFKSEAFNDRNKLLYNDQAMRYPKSELVMFFIVPDDIHKDSNLAKDVTTRRENEIDEMETFFIQEAVKVYPDEVKNMNKRGDVEWRVRNVKGRNTITRSGSGSKTDKQSALSRGTKKLAERRFLNMFKRSNAFE